MAYTLGGNDFFSLSGTGLSIDVGKVTELWTQERDWFEYLATCSFPLTLGRLTATRLFYGLYESVLMSACCDNNLWRVGEQMCDDSNSVDEIFWDARLSDTSDPR